jgi:hypothetical protein
MTDGQTSPLGPPAVSARTMLNHLQGLLEKQLKLVQEGSLTAAVRLCGQTDRCVQQVVKARTHEVPGSADQRQHIERLYRDLCLALTAQRTETSAALRAIRRGRRILNTYSRTGLFRR